MKLFNASIVESVDTFLHAGYISAYPRPLEGGAYPSGDSLSEAQKILELDMQSALRLGEPITDGGVAEASGALIGGIGSGELLFGALALSGLLALYFLLKKPTVLSNLRPHTVVSAAAVSAMLLITPHCGDDGNSPPGDDGSGDTLPTDSPWEEEQPQSYIQPEQATLAILHGIIRPALVNIGQKIENLANIQDEVALPTKVLTDGQRYALRMYGLDGYGNPFELIPTRLKNVDGEVYWQYTVTSAGADEEQGTEDDISATFSQNINDNWSWGADPVYYIVEDGDKAVLLYHRWNHKMFEYSDKAGAKAVTGSDLFDIVPWLNHEQTSAVQTAYDEMKAESDVAPLMLQVFKI